MSLMKRTITVTFLLCLGKIVAKHMAKLSVSRGGLTFRDLTCNAEGSSEKDELMSIHFMRDGEAFHEKKPDKLSS